MAAGDPAVESDLMRTGRKLVERIFRFLEAKSQRENKAIRSIEDQQWSLWFHQIPSHGSITLASREPEAENLGVILRVRADYETPCPAPPAPLRPWIERGWEDLNGSVRVWTSLNSRGPDGETQITLFDADAQRPKLLNEWQAKREAWKPAETRKRKAMALYEELHRQWGELNREGEKVEFVLGDGILSWAHEDGQVYHPILFQRLELEFDPAKREFRFIESSTTPELYGSLLYEVQNTAIPIGNSVRELEKGEYHPLGLEEVSAFLRRVGADVFKSPPAWKEDEIPPRAASTPVIGRKLGYSAVIFRRKRNLGFSTALKHVVQALAEGAKVPAHLLRIVGVDIDEIESDPIPERTWFEYVQPKEILLSKEANREQVRIAETLDKTGAVLVQGPPGTGKTHTIANLIGHLLAQGKRILVTSHSTKALRVLREKVEPPLQPLCVSVLDSDAKSRGELKESVQHLLGRLTDDPARLKSEADRLGVQRETLIGEYYRASDALTVERRKEYDSIVVSGKSYQPSDAARFVASGLGSLDYIPLPIELGKSLPLSDAELSELYESNGSISAADEENFSAGLPGLEALPLPGDFEEHVRQANEIRARLQEMADANTKEYGLPANISSGRDTIELLQALARDAARCAEALKSVPSWQADIIAASLESADNSTIWNDLVEEIEATSELSASRKRIVFQNAPQLPPDMALDEVRDTAAEIVSHFESGGRLSSWTLALHSKWKRFAQNTRVASGAPCLMEHFESLHAEADLTVRRANLVSRWKRQVTGEGAPSVDHPSRHPEDVLRQYVEPLRKRSSWKASEWIPLLEQIQSVGIDWPALFHDFAAGCEPTRELELLIAAMSIPLQSAISCRIARLQHRELEATVQAWTSSLQLREARARSPLAGKLLGAISSLDSVQYQESYNEIARLHGLLSVSKRRQALIQKLKGNGAPGWARAMQARDGIHGKATAPARATEAWQWRQISGELYRRRSSSEGELIANIAKANKRLLEVTRELIAKQTWAKQIDRCMREPGLRRSLAAWLETDKGSHGLGKRALRLKKEASRLLNECRDAVPVWIMPFSRVVESFDPRNAPFDVVIIDEASQMDISGLLALYLAKEIVVVGDNEQVSPLAVGDDMDVIEQLIQTHLVDVPNAHLYDGRLSIYALAEQSFGSTIRLVEHFRCAPEIISFSNHLCYGDIQPLRDTSAIQLKPHTVEHRVLNGIARDKVNMIEAEEIASLVMSASEQPEYETKTIGVVSLVGDEQAREIEMLLRRHLPSEAFESRHKILCGNAAQFQGDERDVMFLSIVDSCDDPPLSLRSADLFKQRFNVAASRARDQMWVVHSLEPKIDLKDGDLRKRLIEHAANPNQISEEIEAMNSKVESDFEREVAQRLIQAEFRVVPQWKVGHYRIDLVVQGRTKRLAVECDGDRYHPHEKLEDDMARQAVLERLGWSFVRIRGSQFYQDRNAALQPLFQRLAELGFEKVGNDAAGTEEPQAETELLIRVKRRAEEIRREWESNPRQSTKLPPLRETEDGLPPVRPHVDKHEDEPSEPRKAAEQSQPSKRASAAIRSPELLFEEQKPKPTERAAVTESASVERKTNERTSRTTSHNGAERAQSVPSAADVAAIDAVSAKDWFSIAKWAADNDHLEGWQRKIAFTLGKCAANSWKPSEKQVHHGVMILKEVRRLGFKSGE